MKISKIKTLISEIFSNPIVVVLILLNIVVFFLGATRGFIEVYK